MDHPRILVTEWNLRKFSWLYEISKLENQLQNWGLFTNSRFSHHIALYQRSWYCQINWPTCNIAVDYQSHFRKRVGVEEQRAQNSARFLQGRSIAYMIYEYFRATGAYEAVQGLSTLIATSLQNDGVQDFDVRWDHALLSASETPAEMVLEGLYKSKLEDSVQLQTVLALYDQETARNNGQPN